jgi:uncharacterized protein (TIRG00374 family)
LRSRRRPSWLYCALGRNEISTAAPPQSAPAPRWKRILPGLLISLVALVVLFSVIDPRETLNALQQANGWILALGMLVSLVWLVIRARVWQTLLQGKASYRDVFLTLNEGYLLNNLLPFRLGEVGRAYLLGRKTKLDFWQVLPSVVLERMFDMIMAAALLILTLPFVAGVSWAGQAAAGTGGLVALGLLGVYLVARNQPRVTAWLERLSQRWPWVQKLVGERLGTFFTGLQVLTDLRRFLRALVWILFNWIFSILLYFIFLRAFYPEASLLWGVFVLGAGSFGVAAPSSPGALGVFEAALVGALTVGLKVDPSPATAFAIALHLSNYINTGLIGGYALLREGETLSSLYSQLGRLKVKA